MRNWLIDKGIKPENVIVEDKSIDTVSNALNSMILIKNLAAKTGDFGNFCQSYSSSNGGS